MPDNSIGAVTSAIGVVVDEHDPAALPVCGIVTHGTSGAADDDILSTGDRCAAGEIQADMQAPCQARRLGPFQRQRQ